MVDDLTGLLVAIIEGDPDDVTLRMAFADELLNSDDRCDQQRAEFIKDSVGLGGEYDPDDVVPYGGRGVFGYKWGMAVSWKCTAATFLRHADELLWHRGQTVACPECRESDQRGMIPYTDHKGIRDHYLCGTCAPPGVTGYRRGTGRVPRPCPPTAQPIRRVVLTTEAPVEMELYEGNGAVYSPRWPGVEFDLPRGTEAVSDDWDGYDADMMEALGEHPS